jgi:hypothetical protein
MLLFIHGIQQSAASFLPIIKSMLGNNSQFEDKVLLDSFCLWMPGYDKKDIGFDHKFIQEEIYEFMRTKSEIQKEIASQLILSNGDLPAKAIKQSKLNIIGCDIGGGVALEFMCNNLIEVGSMCLLDCGYRFDSLRYKWMDFNTRLLLRNDIAKIQTKFETEKNAYQKNFLGNLIQHPSGKGIGTYLDIMSKYNFEKTFNRLSLDLQKEVYRIPVLEIIDKKRGISNNSNIKNLKKIFDTNSNYINIKHTVIDTNTEKNFAITDAAFGQNSILDQGTAKEIAAKIIKFYQSKITQ